MRANIKLATFTTKGCDKIWRAFCYLCDANLLKIERFHHGRDIREIVGMLLVDP